MMAIGEAYALICLDSIVDRTEREQVKNSLEKTGHEIISITHDQMSAFAGNALELINQNGERFLALSQTAYDALTPTQIETIEQTAKLLPIAIPTIERIGGGSVRCMLAEIFTPKRKTWKIYGPTVKHRWVWDYCSVLLLDTFMELVASSTI